MNSLDQLKEYMKTYTQLDDAVHEIDELESKREEKTNFELFQDEGLELKAAPSYYGTIDDEELSDSEEELAETPLGNPNVEGYNEDARDSSEEDDVEVAFTSEWKLPELESDSTGKSLKLFIPDNLTQEQKSQWIATIEALVQSARYWNIAECSVEKTSQGITLKERQMTPDVYKVTPSPNAPEPADHLNQDVWTLSRKTQTFLAKKSGVSPLTISLEELFSSRGEFISVGGHGLMTHKDAILLGLRHKRLYNQARVKYHL
ncbi:phosphoprotein [Vesicular stomatitis Alagoas virus]|uniref:Phosphoprotein n=1 Tax=Vesicular stomatitis Alagoas virus TaxID=198833 RepID=B3FRL2_9RHAB|nr:phosphoprotein [Vesicular stomatitis Alagoas virus]ACB47440.1 phosphoprotein [Vesicular stomatitis Alagoas virus]AYO51727.1 phosphoprotein [Vesicular stomatitis virus]